ncbi:receptor-associated protein of the synapse [Nymphon striatum]|nr:receptor-associated protein of the synapse [Nymphon striatum]
MLITCVKSNDTTNTVEDLKFTGIFQNDLNCYIAPSGFLVPKYPITDDAGSNRTATIIYCSNSVSCFINFLKTSITKDDFFINFSEQRHEDAVRKWKAALRRIAKQSDKFMILGYLCEVHADIGGYREMIDFAFQQLDIAHEIDCNNMRAQAYLNLSIGNVCMSMYAKAISYCDHALQHLTNERDPKTLCRVYIDLSKSYTGQSTFFKSFEYLGLSMKLVEEVHDPVLHLQVLSELGKIFTMLKDFEKGQRYHASAYNIAKTLKPSESRDKHERHTLLNQAGILRKKNRAVDALNHCQDAMKSAINDGDIPAQAYCLFCYGNIYRDRKDVEKALHHYEASMKLMRKLEDVEGQCQVLIGMAKSFVIMKKTRKMCDCKVMTLVANLKKEVLPRVGAICSKIGYPRVDLHRPLMKTIRDFTVSLIQQALNAHSVALQYATQIGNKVSNILVFITILTYTLFML